jgi:hypothetical protein
VLLKSSYHSFSWKFHVLVTGSFISVYLHLLFTEVGSKFEHLRMFLPFQSAPWYIILATYSYYKSIFVAFTKYVTYLPVSRLVILLFPSLFVVLLTLQGQTYFTYTSEKFFRYARKITPSFSKIHWPLIHA